MADLLRTQTTARGKSRGINGKNLKLQNVAFEPLYSVYVGEMRQLGHFDFVFPYRPLPFEETSGHWRSTKRAVSTF
jgi:hypothetical protein